MAKQLTNRQAEVAASELDLIREAAGNVPDKEGWHQSLEAASRFLRNHSKRKNARKRKSRAIRKWEQIELTLDAKRVLSHGEGYDIEKY